jgi:hypothetical protein
VNGPQCARAVVSNALAGAFAQVYDLVPQSVREQVAEQVCARVEQHLDPRRPGAAPATPAEPELLRLLWHLANSGADAMEIARAAEKPWCYRDEHTLAVLDATTRFEGEQL